MVTAPVPVFVTLTVKVMGVLSGSVPKFRLLGTAERLGEAVTGGGVGVGPGLDELAAVLPPQPIALNKAVINTRKRPEYLLVLVLLRNV